MIHRLSPRQETGSKWLTVTLLGIYVIVVLLLATQHTDADVNTNNTQTAKNIFRQQTVYKAPASTELHPQTIYKP